MQYPKLTKQLIKRLLTAEDAYRRITKKTTSFSRAHFTINALLDELFTQISIEDLMDYKYESMKGGK